jgi:hypothetical protein
VTRWKRQNFSHREQTVFGWMWDNRGVSEAMECSRSYGESLKCAQHAKENQSQQRHLTLQLA